MPGSDYYFKQTKVEGVGGTMNDAFIITSKALFDKEGVWDDQEIPSSDLPPGFGEDGECLYSYVGTTAAARKALLTAGFIENKKL